MTIEARTAEYKALKAIASDLYSADNFPGSKAWHAAEAAEDAVTAFRRANPDVIAAINAARAARPAPEYVTDQSSTYNRAIAGRD